jgi:lipoprotein-anchoring transpeptidase ErfK/SrfK
LAGAGCTSGGKAAAVTRTTTTTVASTTTTQQPPPGVPEPTKVALAAIATGDSVAVHPAPGDPAVSMKLSNPTIERMLLAMMVVDRQGDWLQVRLPMRPNGAMGWVEAREVQLSPVDNRIVISVGDRRLRLLNAQQQTIFDTSVAVGKPSTPTPLGRFFVDVWLPNPGSPYGKFMLSISGFSDVLKTFAGGRGQIAMHGWSDPGAMGKNVSNGCIRMRNEDITRLAELAPLGTPVEIVA